MNEKDQYVTQNDFKAALLEIKEQMQPLANLDAMIFKNILKVTLFVLIPLGGTLIWWIDRELDQNQTHIASLEAVNFTPTNEILLTKMTNFLEAYNKSEKNKISSKSKRIKKINQR